MDKSKEQELLNRLERAEKLISKLEKELQEKDEIINLLKGRIFGKKTEKLAEGQMTLFEVEKPDQNDELSEESAEFIEKTVVRRTPVKKVKGKRQADLSKFEQVDIVHKCEDRTCPDCGNEMAIIGKKLQYQELTIKPIQFVCKNHYVETYRCADLEHHSDGNERLEQATTSHKPLFPHSYYSPSVLAQVAQKKFEMAVPLHRQQLDMKSQGFELSSKSMSGAIIKTAEVYLKDIYNLLRDRLLDEEVIHMDETPFTALEKDTNSHRTYFWVAQSTKEFSKHQIVFYRHFESRKTENVGTMFDNRYQNAVMCDGYKAYSSKAYPDITFGACLVHVRRNFVEIVKSLPTGKSKSLSREAVRLLGAVFDCEKNLKYSTPAEKVAARQKKLLGLYNNFFDFITSIKNPMGKLKKAIDYALSQRDRLMMIFKIGQMPLSNNSVEQSIRPSTLIRKNCLFAKTLRGAQANAIFYTLTQTAKLNNLNVFKYFKFLLEGLTSRKKVDLEAYLPWSPAVQAACRA